MYAALQLVAAITGVGLYFGYFSHGEHHLNGVIYLRNHTLAFMALVSLCLRLGFSLKDAFLEVLAYDAVFLGGLYSSLVVYRAFFNPLNIFPGPMPARISSFDMTLRIRKGQMYKTLQGLHAKYGQFVRIGTGEISITHPSAVREIFGNDSVCEKSIWYDISRPQDSLLLRRTYAGHAELRSVWSHAFSIKAIKGYEERVKVYRAKLMQGIDAQQGSAVDVNHWLALYSWDVLSDLSFGHPFGMLDRQDKHWAIKILKKGMSIVGFHWPMWWIEIMKAIPGGNSDMKTMLKYCQEEMLLRWKEEPKQADVMSHLFAPYRENKKAFDEKAVNLLAGEAHLLINAGSDTTRVTMACALYALTKDPKLAERVRTAIEPAVQPDGTIRDEDVMNIDILNGLISESLRMYPPSPSHPTRVTPPDGTTIAGTFIPGGTQLMCPQYVIGRDETVFARPNEFIPERWYSEPELIKIKDATAPFSLGPWNCIGKPLAMTNVRVTLATIVARYNLSFAPGRADPVTDFEEGMCEHFSLQPGPLMLRMDKRL